jgi:hypothetical protein
MAEAAVHSKTSFTQKTPIWYDPGRPIKPGRPVSVPWRSSPGLPHSPSDRSPSPGHLQPAPPSPSPAHRGAASHRPHPPRLASPRLALPRLALPRLAPPRPAPRIAPPRISPPLASPRPPASPMTGARNRHQAVPDGGGGGRTGAGAAHLGRAWPDGRHGERLLRQRTDGRLPSVCHDPRGRRAPAPARGHSERRPRPTGRRALATTTGAHNARSWSPAIAIATMSAHAMSSVRPDQRDGACCFLVSVVTGD